MHHLWKHLNPSSKPIFSNNRMNAINFLNLCTAPFPLSSAVLRAIEIVLLLFNFNLTAFYKHCRAALQTKTRTALAQHWAPAVVGLSIWNELSSSLKG